MIFNAYYDESGTHDSSPITVLAGMIGRAEEWGSFELEWRKVLKKYDLRFIRAKQLFHKQGPYRGWPQKQIDYLWADILYVLQEHKRFAVTKTVLRTEDYKRSYTADPPLRRERLDTKYALCLRCCLHFHPLWHQRLHKHGGINFVLEAGHRNAGDALRVYKELKDSRVYRWRDHIGALSFGTKADFPALQAADLVAYWFYKTEMEKIAEDIENPFDVSDLEIELSACGLAVMEHLITPLDLANLRQNFLAKQKRKVFGKSNAILRSDEFFEGQWGEEKHLIGVEVSPEELGSAYSQIQHPFRQRR